MSRTTTIVSTIISRTTTIVSQTLFNGAAVSKRGVVDARFIQVGHICVVSCVAINVVSVVADELSILEADVYEGRAAGIIGRP
jgi:hypothetical protein